MTTVIFFPLPSQKCNFLLNWKFSDHEKLERYFASPGIFSLFKISKSARNLSGEDRIDCLSRARHYRAKPHSVCIRQTRNLTFWYIWMKNDGICPGKIEYGCKFHCQKMTWFRSSRVAKFYRLAWYSLGKLTPILMRSAASTIFRRIILNVCGGGPPVKWERKQKIKTQKKQEGKKWERKVAVWEESSALFFSFPLFPQSGDYI